MIKDIAIGVVGGLIVSTLLTLTSWRSGYVKGLCNGRAEERK